LTPGETKKREERKERKAAAREKPTFLYSSKKGGRGRRESHLRKRKPLTAKKNNAVDKGAPHGNRVREKKN